MKDLREEVATLHTQQSHAEANVSFLKQVVKSLTKVYGFENIGRVIETIDTDVNTETPLLANQELNPPRLPRNGFSAEFENKNLHRLSKGYQQANNYQEELAVGKNLTRSTEYKSANSTPYSLDQYLYNPTELTFGGSQSLPEPGFGCALNIFEDEPQADMKSHAINNNYMNWLVEFEKMKNNTEAYMEQLGGYPVAGADVNEMHRNKSRYTWRADC